MEKDFQKLRRERLDKVKKFYAIVLNSEEGLFKLAYYDENNLVLLKKIKGSFEIVDQTGKWFDEQHLVNFLDQ